MRRKMLFTGYLCLAICFCACEVYSQNTNLQKDTNVVQLQQQLNQMKAKINEHELAMQQLLSVKLQNINQRLKDLEANFNNQLNLQGGTIDKLERTVGDNRITTMANKESMSCHFTIVTWFAVVVIGLVGLFGGIVAWVAYKKEHDIYQRLSKRADDSFSNWKTKTETLLQTTFSEWLEEQKVLFEKEIDLDQTYMNLVCLFEPPPPHSENIFSSVRMISDAERKIYRPLLIKIAQSEWVDARVKQVAEEGLEKLDAL